MTTYSADSASARKSINNLIDVLHDGEKGYAQSAEHVKSPALKTLFTRYAQQRTSFAAALQGALVNFGEEPTRNEEGTTAGALHRGWIGLKGTLVQGDDHAVLAEVEKGEDIAKKAYSDALENTNLPADLRQIVLQQSSEVLTAHNEVKALRDAAKTSKA